MWYVTPVQWALHVRRAACMRLPVWSSMERAGHACTKRLQASGRRSLHACLASTQYSSAGSGQIRWSTASKMREDGMLGRDQFAHCISRVARQGDFTPNIQILARHQWQVQSQIQVQLRRCTARWQHMLCQNLPRPVLVFFAKVGYLVPV